MKKVWLLVVFVICAIPVFAQDNGFKIGDTTWTFNGEIRFMYTDQTDPSFYQYMIYDKGPGFAEYTDSINRMYQRYRFGVTGAMSDRLSAHFELQVGDEQWGNKNYNEREVNLRTLYAYLQFRPEFLGDNTTFKVGLQGYDDIFQNAIFSDEGVGILINHKTDTFNANIGYLTLRDDDVDQDVLPGKSKAYPVGIGIYPCSETLFIADMNYIASDSLNLKGAFYYDYIRDFMPGDEDSYNYHMAYFGAGADYVMNDSLSFGTHFVMRSGKVTEYENNVEDFTVNVNGWFAYADAVYTADKFKARLNFGYTPYDVEFKGDSVDITSWSGAFPLVDYGFAYSEMLLMVNGAQWQNGYGLEYFGRGDVCDRQAVNSGYGGLYGMMVISANLEYDFMFANFGIMRATFNDDLNEGEIELDKNMGTEIDLGVKTEIMKSLEFRAVYAMFFAGDFYTFAGERTVDDAHEMSMLLRYKF